MKERAKQKKMTRSHSFRPLKAGSNRCASCGGWSGDACHSLELFSDADREREAARQLAEAEELTAILHSAKENISAKSGRMEREAPLFYGTGANPTLF